MKVCCVCGKTILNPQLVKVCGDQCAQEHQRKYHAEYHRRHLEKRREAARLSWAKYAATHPRLSRKPLNKEQKVRRNERQKALRSRPEWKEKERKRRRERSPEQKARHLQLKRESYQRCAQSNCEKRNKRRRQNPEQHRQAMLKYQRKISDLIAVLRVEMPDLMKEFGL